MQYTQTQAELILGAAAINFAIDNFVKFRNDLQGEDVSPAEMMGVLEGALEMMKALYESTIEPSVNEVPEISSGVLI